MNKHEHACVCVQNCFEQVQTLITRAISRHAILLRVPDMLRNGFPAGEYGIGGSAL